MNKILQLIITTFVLLASPANAYLSLTACEGEYTAECYSFTQPPAFVKLIQFWKSCDDWVLESLEGFGSRCCDLTSGNYTDNGCTCPMKNTEDFQSKIVISCEGIMACTTTED